MFSKLYLLHHQVGKLMLRLLIILRAITCIVALSDSLQAIKSLIPWVIVKKPQDIDILSRFYSYYILEFLPNSYAFLVIESLSKKTISIPNLIILQFLIDDIYIYLLSVNFSYRQAVKMPCP